jgi:hypothetical protein
MCLHIRPNEMKGYLYTVEVYNDQTNPLGFNSNDIRFNSPLTGTG